MKTLKLFILVTLLPLSSLLAQVPQAMKYQTVIRNADGVPLANTNVGLRFTILQDDSEVYEETYDINTNDNGLVNLNLGQGNTTDNFSSISWGSGEFELEVEVDTNGGTNYQEVGTSPLLSVPFALTAQTALDVDDADSNPSNELQSLSLSGNILSISSGNTVTLPSGGASAEEAELSKVWARVGINGTCNLTFDAYNVTNTSKPSTGVYVISLSPGLFSVATNPSVVCSVMNDLAPGVAIPTYSSSPSQITVRTYDMNGNLSDRAFNITVFGK